VCTNLRFGIKLIKSVDHTPYREVSECRKLLSEPLNRNMVAFFRKTSFFKSIEGNAGMIINKHVSLCPGCTSALGLLCILKHSIQHRFNNPVPLIKRQRYLSEAVLISFGSAISFPKTL
jgi:hypothetical protein